MNSLKLIIEKGCGYLIDIVFGRQEKIVTSLNFDSLPKAVNDDPYIFSIFHYKNATVKKLIKQIKYKGSRKATMEASRILYDYLLEDVGEKVEMSNFTRPVIIPIPSTKFRQKEYGFNQCERIVRNIEKLNKSDFFDIQYNVLIKIKENKSQAFTKNKKERLKNIKDSFSINFPDLISKRNIILIDDVWTTGATINEARNELIKAGAKNVMAYTIAH